VKTISSKVLRLVSQVKSSWHNCSGNRRSCLVWHLLALWT